MQRITRLKGELKGLSFDYAPLPLHLLLEGPHGAGKTTRITAAGLALTGEAPELALVDDVRDPARLGGLLAGGEPGTTSALAEVDGVPSSWELTLVPGARAGTITMAGPRFTSTSLFPVDRLLALLARPGNTARLDLITWAGAGLPVPEWLEEARVQAEIEGAAPMAQLSAPELLRALSQREAGAEEVAEVETVEAPPALQVLLDELGDDAVSPEIRELIDGADTTEGTERAPTLEGLFARLRLQGHVEGKREGMAAADAAAALYVATGAMSDGLSDGLVSGLTRVRAEARIAATERDWTLWLCEAVLVARRQESRAEQVAEQAWEVLRANCGDDALAGRLITLGQRLMELPIKPVELPTVLGSDASRDYQALWREYELTTARAESAEAALAQRNEDYTRILADLAEECTRPRADTEEIEQLKAIIAARDEGIEAIAKELSYTQQAHSETAARLVEAQGQVHALQEQVDNLTTALRTTNTEHDDLFFRLTAAEQARSEAETRADVTARAHHTLTNRYDALLEALRALRAEFTPLTENDR